MEVLPLDLYFDVQDGAAVGQVSGDDHLELPEPEVSVEAAGLGASGGKVDIVFQMSIYSYNGAYTVCAIQPT